MKIHKAAEIFPVMNNAEYEELKASIAASGLLQPITVYEGAILDGRNREKACRELGIEVRTVEFSGDDPIEFVWMMNYHRRHLSTDQKAMAEAAKANMQEGRPKKTAQICAVSQSKAAEQAGVSRRTIQHAAKVLADGVPELAHAVTNGKIAVSEAAQIATLDADAQYEVIKSQTKKERKQKTKTEQAKAKHERQKEQPEEAFMLKGQTAKIIEPFYLIEDWLKLPKIEREKIIEAGFESKAKMNQQDTRSIEWAKHSHNTVTGCKHDCPYCYARDIAERYFEIGFEPAFYPSRLSAPANHKLPEEAATDTSFQNIFANSMSDLFGKWVPADWIEATIEMANRNPEWNFLTLTKFPQRAADFQFPKNWWMGTTVDAQVRVAGAEKAFEKIQCGTKWLSCEPLLESLKFNRLNLFQWIVIGGASRSNKCPEWIPPFDWITNLHEQARAAGCRMYYKTNCGIPDEMRVREFPWAKPEIKSLPKPFHYLKGIGK